MSELLAFVLAFSAGVGLGAIFFAGLWWTVRQALLANHPALWIVGSLLLRMAVLLCGIYWVAGGSWQRMLACVVGFVTTKLVATWLALPRSVNPKESAHAP